MIIINPDSVVCMNSFNMITQSMVISSTRALIENLEDLPQLQRAANMTLLSIFSC